MTVAPAARLLTAYFGLTQITDLLDIQGLRPPTLSTSLEYAMAILKARSVVPTSVIIQQDWRSGGSLDCRFPVATGQNRSVVVNSLVQCLALLQPHNGDLRAVTFDPGTGNCKSAIDSSNNLYVTETRAIPSHVGECIAQWTKVLEVNTSGSGLYGSVDAVKMAVKNGSEIRIQIKPDLFLELIAINVEGDQVCGLAIFILSKTSLDVFEEDLYWKLTRICTTGKMYQMRTLLGTPISKEQLTTNESAIWFSRSMVQRTSAENPVFCSADVTPCGSIADVISAAEQGAYITVDIHHKSTTSYFAYGSRLQFVYGSTCEAAVHLPWFISRRDEMRFHKPPFWFMLLVSTGGTYQVSRWYIGRHVYKDIQSSYDGKVEWYIDSCWQLAYSHREDGETISGSITTLLNYLLNGRRIRIVFDSFSMEAEILSLTTDL